MMVRRPLTLRSSPRRGAAVLFLWRASAGRGAYVPKATGVGVTSNSTQLSRYTTTRTPTREITPEVADARRFEERLAHAAAQGSFLALKVRPKLLVRTERELSSRYGVRRCNVERLLIAAMKADISIETPERLEPIRAVPTDLEQVLLNLTNNAIDALAASPNSKALRYEARSIEKDGRSTLELLVTEMATPD